MASIWNNHIGISIFGEAKGPAIGIAIDNLPAGEYLDTQKLHQFLTRYSMKQNPYQELHQVMSGILNERTTGSPLCAFIQNTEQPVQEVSQINRLPRPGHADYTGTLRYHGFNDIRDGGHVSTAMMAPFCFAGAVCGQILERRGIYTGAHIQEIHGIQDKHFNHTTVTKDDILAVRYKKFPVIKNAQGKKMQEDIQAAFEGGETLGGAIECVAVNVPAGIGSPVFNGLENTIAQLLFALPDIRGLSFGAGFQVTEMTGSQSNDNFYVDEHGHVKTYSNNHGGILGGISSGMPIVLHVAFKPSATVGKIQKTVNLSSMEQEEIQAESYLEACLLPKLVPCVESAVNIALLSHMLDYPHFC
ncbi:MAG: chorismate synthase [Oscillospiraceae bacterium]|nr:chorismate synthase [Oscillospiraceae bacterium]MDE6777288.1 chorismate synthase [Oscillospiraceae bacterium]